MTSDDFERQSRGFYGFFWRFRAARHISRANCTEINRDERAYGQPAYIKFSALNVDFDGPSLGFLSSRKPAHEGIK